MQKIILAFSGGLDTSFAVPYLINQGYQVITATVNTGSFSKEELKTIAQKSKSLGAIKHYEIDAQKQLYEKIGSYIIKANYLKGGVYPACVGPERIVIAMEIAKIALKEKVKNIAHGSTSAGNDQVRFDLALRALIPNCNIITPIRENNFSREEEVKLLNQQGIKVENFNKDYSINVGLLGTTIGGKETKQTDKEIPENIFPNVKTIDKTPNKAVQIKIDFEKGLPVKLNGKKLDPVELINTLNKIAAQYGFGKDYHIGTTIIGIKGKVAFEAPALKVLIKAHSELEKITLTSKQLFWKNILGNLYGDLIHEGLYFEPLIKNIEEFMDSANQFVTGEVIAKIHKGNLTITSLTSPYSLFNTKLGTYGEQSAAYSGIDAKGFCKIYGMESVNAYLTQSLKKNL